MRSPYPTLLGWAGASVLILACVTSFSPQGLHFYDPVIQSLAQQQYVSGRSPSWIVFMRVDPHDVARDIPEFITWWPPSTQLLTLPLQFAGATPALSLRLVALLAIILGTAGWVLWLGQFALPRAWLIALAVGLPWLRAVSVFLFRYSPDALAFAALPWILLLHIKFLQRLQRGSPNSAVISAGTGLATGLTFGLKYSLGVAASASLFSVWLRLLVGRPSTAAVRATVKPMLIAAASVLLFPLAWRIATTHFGGSTPLGHPAREGFDPMDFIFLVANPALALADLFGPLFYALVHPGLPPISTGTLDTVAWIGLPGGAMLAYLLARAVRRNAANAPVWVGVVTLAGTSGALFGLWFFADVSHEPRLIAPAALGVLPIALQEGRRLAAAAGRPLPRYALMAAASLFVALPLGFGPCYVVAKVRAAGSIRTGPTGLNLPNLQSRDIASARTELGRHVHPNAVWVVADPELALELPGRTILLSAGRSIAEDLRNLYRGTITLAKWRSGERRELLVLWPPSANGELPPVLASAGNVQGWRRTNLRHSNLVLWSGWLPAAP